MACRDSGEVWTGCERGYDGQEMLLGYKQTRMMHVGIAGSSRQAVRRHYDGQKVLLGWKQTRLMHGSGGQAVRKCYDVWEVLRGR